MPARLLPVLISLFLFNGTAVADGYYPVVDRYLLDAEFVPAKAWMIGAATVFFLPGTDYQRTAVGYLHGELSVDSITAAGGTVEFAQQKVFYDYEYSLVATEIRIPLTGLENSPGVTVHYQGQMNPSTVGSPSNYMRIDGNGVYLRSYGYSLWFPVFLPPRQDGYSVNFERAVIRTPEDFHSIFVGEKTTDVVDQGTRTTKWQALNVHLFDAQCTAQRYQVTAVDDYYAYHYDDSLSVTMADKLLDFARRLVARYKEVYRGAAGGDQCFIMEMPKYGDISSGNVTGLSEKIWHSFEEQHWAQRGLAHELVHPYVRTNTSKADPLWSTAIEGFPSYFHLPILAEILGEKWYAGYIQEKEDAYLKRCRTGRGWRNRVLPPEKPLLEITARELPDYKDEFVINDRVLLFLHYLYVKMGKDNFFKFTRDLFSQTELTAQSFRALIEKHLPGSEEDIETWLETTNYPERLHVANLAPSR